MVFHTIGDPARLAYICVVNHRYTGDVEEVSGQFRHRVHVVDGTGESELSSGIGKSSFKIVYSTEVKQNRNGYRRVFGHLQDAVASSRTQYYLLICQASLRW